MKWTAAVNFFLIFSLLEWEFVIWFCITFSYMHNFKEKRFKVLGFPFSLSFSLLGCTGQQKQLIKGYILILTLLANISQLVVRYLSNLFISKASWCVSKDAITLLPSILCGRMVQFIFTIYRMDSGYQVFKLH